MGRSALGEFYMRKLFLLFIILFVLPAQFSLAQVTKQDVPDPLSQYNVKNEVTSGVSTTKSILQKVTEEWKKINDWGIKLWTKNFETSFLRKYTIQLKENIKQGLLEENKEYSQDIFKGFGVTWEKVKNFVFHKKGG